MPDVISDETVYRNVLWVELDGVRFDQHVVSVQGKWGEGFHTTLIEVAGLPEFVPIDREGTPIPLPPVPR